MRTNFFALLFFALTFTLAPVTASSLPAEPTPPPIPKNIRFERLGLEDGLSQSAILATLQDHQGYLWFGTQDGLNRYDGYSFTVFRHDAEDSNSLSSSGILSLAEDADGYLWIGTWGGGLNRYNPITEKFTAYQNNPNNPSSLSEDTITDLLIAHDGTMWIATHGGLNRMNPDGTFTRFQHTADVHSLSADNLSVLFEDREGTLWIGTGFGIEGNGLNRMNADGTFTRYLHDPNNPNSLNSNNIGTIFQDDLGNLWIGTGGYSLAGGGLDYMTNPVSGTFTHFQHDPDNLTSLSADNVMSLWQDPDGLLWIGTWGGGINLYDPNRLPAIFHHVVNDPYNPHSLSFDVVWDIFSDRSGIVWVGTVPGGISKFTPRSAQFDLYQVQPAIPNSLQNEIISGFFEEPDDTFWVTTWGGGFARFDHNTGAFFHYRHDPADPQSLPNDVVSVLYKDSTGKYWIGTSIGTFLFEPSSETFTPVLRNPDDPASNITATTNSITEDKAGFVWISTLEGLEKYDPKTQRITPYLNDPEKPGSLSADICTQVFVDREGTVWVGTWGGGLNRYDPQTGTFTRYAHTDDPGSLSNDAVWTFQQDHLGQLWIGTEGGLNRMNADGTFTSYRLKDGLPNENVSGIEEDAEGNLWISTGNGLARFDPVAETFKVFSTRDGLQSNEFNSGASFKDRAGLMYFGGVHGFNVFDPAQIRDNQTPPPIVISTFRVFNEPLPVDLSGKTRLEIPYWQNFIAFEYAALDFQDPQKNQYAYQLEGFDSGWIEAGDRRYASYTSLPAGNYTFRVKASNSDGLWNETGVAIPLTIIPPLWQRWWFLTGAGFLALGLVVFAFVARLRSLHSQQAHLERLVVHRTAELQNTNQQLEAEVDRRTRAEAALAKRAEEELQQSEARFQAMYNQSVIGIGILGLDGKILDANATVCRLLGRSLEELQKIRFTEVIHPEDRAHGGDEFFQMLKGERDSYRIERRYIRGDGSIFWANVIVSMILDLDGKPRFAVGMMEDTTEKKQTEKELKESQAQLASQEAEYLHNLEQRVIERTYELTGTNQRLQEEIAQRQRVEQALAEKAAEEAVIAERTRLARDLHDAVTQTLFSASLIAEVLPDLWDINHDEALKSTDELKQLTRGALAEMRTLLLELRPAALTQARFEDLIKQLAEALIGRARLPIQVQIDGERKLPPDIQVALYRIAQEALNNVAKYAQASQVDVHIMYSASGVHLEIADNGIGFELNQGKPTSLGLRIMRERAEAIEAELSIESHPGQGTRVAVTWMENQIGM